MYLKVVSLNFEINFVAARGKFFYSAPAPALKKASGYIFSTYSE
jgi:hypothetical protein